MSPRRGAGGNGAGSSGGDGSSSTSCGTAYPCRSELRFMYGYSSASLYSNADLYGQLVPAVVWGLAFAVLPVWALARRPRPRGPWLVVCSTAFVAAGALLAARYGLIASGADVPVAYRYESSVVVLFERVGTLALLAAVFAQITARPPPPRLSSGLALDVSPSAAAAAFAFWIVWLVAAALDATYVVLDFLLSAAALAFFRDGSGGAAGAEWRLGDRDFVLAMDGAMVARLKSLGGVGQSPGFVASRFVDESAGQYIERRDAQVKVGAAADALALAMVVAVVAVALGVALCRDGERWDRKSQQGCGDGSRRTVWLVIAALGLLLTTLFRVVIVARYILPNWTVVSDVWRWADWIASYPDRDSVLDPIRPPDGFLEGYHIAADGVPVAQAVLGPLGILVSLVAVVFLSGMGRAWGPAPRISAEPRK